MLIRCHRNLSHVYVNWPMEKLIWLYITSLKVADPIDNSLYVFFAQRLPNWHYSSIMSLLIKYFHLFNLLYRSNPLSHCDSTAVWRGGERYYSPHFAEDKSVEEVMTDQHSEPHCKPSHKPHCLPHTMAVCIALSF